MISRAELISNKRLREDRAYGALIGLAIGDSFGDAARTPENHFKFGITMDFDEGSSWSTDDTEFAMLTAATLIKAKGELTTQHVVEAWQQHVVTQQELKRGGASEMEAAMNLKRGLRPPETGKYNAYHMSDGAAMRITPIGIVCAGDPERAARLAEIDASISHWRDGIWGAQAVAAGVAVALVGGTVDEIIETALKTAPEDSWFRHSFLKALAIIESSESFEAAWTPLHTELATTYKAAVPEAVTEAFAIFKLINGDFRKGVIYGGNFGRDADTIAAIVGGLAGALHGAKNIPERWKEKARYPSGTCLQFTKGLDVHRVACDLAKLIQ